MKNRVQIEKGQTYRMDIEGNVQFWLYDVETFLYSQSYVVRIQGENFSGLRTLRFRHRPTVGQVTDKYIDFYINGNFWGGDRRHL